MRRKDEDEGGRVADEESETEDLGTVEDLVSGTLSAGQSQSADFMIEVVFNIHLFSNRHQSSQSDTSR